MFRAIKENFDNLVWSQEKKETAKEYFDATWRHAIQQKIQPEKDQLLQKIYHEEEFVTQIINLQKFIISINDQRKNMSELCQEHPQIAEIFKNADKNFLFYLDYPPNVFLVKENFIYNT